jgi:hypothetical protein
MKAACTGFARQMPEEQSARCISIGHWVVQGSSARGIHHSVAEVSNDSTMDMK